MGPKSKEIAPQSERLQLKLLLSKGGDDINDNNLINKKNKVENKKKDIKNSYVDHDKDEIMISNIGKKKKEKKSVLLNQQTVEVKKEPVVNRKGKSKQDVIESNKQGNDIEEMEPIEVVQKKRGRKSLESEEKVVTKVEEKDQIVKSRGRPSLNKNQGNKNNEKQENGDNESIIKRKSIRTKTIIEEENVEEDVIDLKVDISQKENNPDKVQQSISNEQHLITNTNNINITNISVDDKEEYLDTSLTSGKKRNYSSIEKTEVEDSKNINISDKKNINISESTTTTISKSDLESKNSKIRKSIEVIDINSITNQSNLIKKQKLLISNIPEEKKTIIESVMKNPIITPNPITTTTITTKSYNTASKKVPKDLKWINELEKIAEESEILSYAKTYPHEYLFHGRPDEDNQQTTSYWGSFLSYKDDKMSQDFIVAKDNNNNNNNNKRNNRNNKANNSNTIKEIDIMQLFSVDDNINDPPHEADTQRFLNYSLSLQDDNIKTEYKNYHSSDIDNIFAGCPISTDQSLKFWGIRQCSFLTMEIKKKEQENIRLASIQKEKRELEEIQKAAKQLEEELLIKKYEEVKKKKEEQERRLQLSRKKFAKIESDKNNAVNLSAEPSMHNDKMQKNINIRKESEDYGVSNKVEDKQNSFRKEERRGKSKSPNRSRNNEKSKYNEKPSFVKHRSRSRSRSNGKGKYNNIDNRDNKREYLNTNDFDTRHISSRNGNDDYYKKDERDRTRANDKSGQYNSRDSYNTNSRENRDFRGDYRGGNSSNKYDDHSGPYRDNNYKRKDENLYEYDRKSSYANHNYDNRKKDFTTRDKQYNEDSRDYYQRK